jgi:hypothetical protein
VDLLPLSFVSAAALVGVFVLMLLGVLLVVDSLGLIRIEVSVDIWFEDRADGRP